MAKPQPRWAKLDMKEIRNVLVDLGVPAVSWLPDDGGALLTFQQLVSLYTNRRTNQPMGTDKFAQECFAEAKMILEHFHKGSKPTGYGLNPRDWTRAFPISVGTGTQPAPSLALFWTTTERSRSVALPSQSLTKSARPVAKLRSADSKKLSPSSNLRP